MQFKNLKPITKAELNVALAAADKWKLLELWMETNSWSMEKTAIERLSEMGEHMIIRDFVRTVWYKCLTPKRKILVEGLLNNAIKISIKRAKENAKKKVRLR